MVLYETDNYWCRARILRCNPNGSYLVVLVDWGNDYLVGSYEKLRTPYHFGEIPSLANRVILDQIVPNKKDCLPFEWDKSVLDNLHAYIVYSGNGFEIRMKYAEDPVDDLPIKVKMIHVVKTRDEKTGKSKVVDIGKRMVILGEAKETDFDSRIHKQIYDIWEMNAVLP